MLYGKLGVDSFFTSELLYPKMKVRLCLIGTWPNFYMIRDNPNVGLGIVDCLPYTRRVVLTDDYHEKRMDMLPWSTTNSRPWQRHLSFLPHKTSLFNKTIFSLPQFAEMLLQREQSSGSLDHILKIHSGINNSISDNLEYSEEVSQS